MIINVNGCAYKLTDAELEEAYREKEHQYKLQDAERQLIEYFVGDAEVDDGANKDCIDQYGRSIDDMINPKSENYILEEIVTEYENLFDCNRDENSTWEEACEKALTLVLIER